MFGRRADGVRIRQKDTVARMLPMFLNKRTTSTNYFLYPQDADKMDEFIALKKLDGINYTYRDIMLTILVRIFATRPKFNRFYVKDRLYQRKHIDIAMMVHKNLRQGDNEIIVKVRYTGYETIAEIKEKLDNAIETAIEDENTTKSFGLMPNWFLRFSVGCLKFFDKRGLLSDKLLFKQSPFHCSILFADLKSIHVDYVFHHLYEFGNCGFFVTLGKEKMQAVVDEDSVDIVKKKVAHLGVSIDERPADGLYYSHMIKCVKRYTADLSYLEQPLQESEIFIPKDLKQKWKKR
ncbi:MAG: hypothetical protein FWE01_02665 [Firmicutes bacterium]|nr:hypothetical protein [Bacillota bacterium]